MSLCLSEEEVRELTGLQRPTAQARELNHLGINHRMRRDGSIAVLRQDVDYSPKKPVRSKATSPDWRAMC